MKKTFIFLVFIFLFSCIDYVEDYRIDIDDILRVSLENRWAYADGQMMKIRAAIPVETRESDRKVKFKSQGVKFQPGDVSEIEAEARFTSRDSLPERYVVIEFKLPVVYSDSVTITTSVKQERFGRVTFIKLLRAYPESIKVSASAFVAHASYASEVTLKAKVSRGTGMVTSGAPVVFRVENANGQVVSHADKFREPKLSSNVEGEASVIFTPGDDLPVGEYYIVATATKEDKTAISDKIRITVREPE
jgi:hypothetical protein